MKTHNEIFELFGAPLNTVPQPTIPFKPNKWHYIGGAVVICLAAYGAYTIYNNFRNSKNKLEED